MDTQQTYAAYLPHIRKRWEVEQKGWQERRQQAWIVARQIATLLPETVQATGTDLAAFGRFLGAAGHVDGDAGFHDIGDTDD